MEWPGFLRSPRARRVLGAAALGLGAWVALNAVAPVTPREVTLAVSLRAIRARDGAAGRVRSVRVALARGGETRSTVEERFTGGGAPAVWERVVSVPPGEYLAEVAVQTDESVRERRETVRIEAGARVELAAPRAE